jgi:hypothetical protein
MPGWLWPLRPETRRTLGVGFLLAVLFATTSVGLGIAAFGASLLVALAGQYGARFTDPPTRP